MKSKSKLKHIQETYKRGINYYHGENGVKKDRSKAFDAFSEAAKYGHKKSIVELGCMYFIGEGPTKRQNFEKALQTWQKPEVSRDKEALYGIGMVHHLGSAEIKQDKEMAVEYFRKSAKLKYKLAIDVLKEYYLDQWKIIKEEMTENNAPNQNDDNTPTLVKSTISDILPTSSQRNRIASREGRTGAVFQDLRLHIDRNVMGKIKENLNNHMRFANDSQEKFQFITKQITELGDRQQKVESKLTKKLAQIDPNNYGFVDKESFNDLKQDYQNFKSSTTNELSTILANLKEISLNQTKILKQQAEQEHLLSSLKKSMKKKEEKQKKRKKDKRTSKKSSSKLPSFTTRHRVSKTASKSSKEEMKENIDGNFETKYALKMQNPSFAFQEFKFEYERKEALPALDSLKQKMFNSIELKNELKNRQNQ